MCICLRAREKRKAKSEKRKAKSEKQSEKQTKVFFWALRKGRIQSLSLSLSLSLFKI
jgi:hypothetical protein